MASVQRIPSGKYAVRWREGERHRSRTFTLAADAERFRAEATRRLELGESILSVRDVPLLREEAISWLASKHDLAPSTERLYADVIESAILPELGGLRLTDLRPRLLEGWQQKLLRDGRGARGVQTARGVLSQILDRAVAHEYLPANHLKAVKGPRQSSRKQVEPATVEQVERIREQLTSARQRAMVSVLAYTGLRPPQEAMALMWSDLEGPRLRVRRRNVYGTIKPGLKQGCPERVVDLPTPVAAELAELRLRLGRPSGLIFCRRDGNPWTRADWGNWRNRKFKPAAREAGLTATFAPYDLRHTCASLMLAAGRPLPEIAHQLGHSIAVCASVYSHLVDAYRGQDLRPLQARVAEARALSVRRERA